MLSFGICQLILMIVKLLPGTPRTKFGETSP